MKKLNKVIKGHKYLIFMDFEATQFSHEMIAMGVVLASLDKNGRIKHLKDGLKLYVKPKNKIGSYVKKLTGITEEVLEKEGIPFVKAMKQFRRYCGTAYKKASFIAFGNQDIYILTQSVMYNFDADNELIAQIKQNYIDFSSFLAEFTKDDNNNPLSLSNYCKHYKVEEKGTAHDPLYDALNLAYLYNAFIDHPEIVYEDYLKRLGKNNKMPEPVQEIVKKLICNESVDSEYFKSRVKKYLE